MTADHTTKPGVLFVDDEEDLLAGLRSGLRRQRKALRLHFAVGGEAAIEVLAREPIDLVVSDMRMPGMSGVDLLRHVKREHPTVIRYVLSGEAEEQLVVNAVSVAHRWLTKPCDRDDVVEAVNDALGHRMLLDDGAAQAIASVDALASPPTLYAQLHDRIADEDVSIPEVSTLIERDPAITAKVLQWANSAFAAGGGCADVPGAVARIGLRAVSQLVLIAEVFRATRADEAVPGFDDGLLHRHVEHIAELAAHLSPADPAARLGGLLSHIGLLIEAAHLPDRLEAAYELALDEGVSLVDAERRLFGSAHPDLGGFLLAMWGLPSDLVLAVREAHHHPRAHSGDVLRAVDAVQVARLLALDAPHARAIGVPHITAHDRDLAAALRSPHPSPDERSSS